jgi:cytochrome c oxidase subunit II
MIYLVGLLALVFLVLTLLVVSRLSSVLKGVSTSGETSEYGLSNRINGMLFLAFLVFGTIAAGWSFIEASVATWSPDGFSVLAVDGDYHVCVCCH